MNFENIKVPANCKGKMFYCSAKLGKYSTVFHNGVVANIIVF